MMRCIVCGHEMLGPVCPKCGFRIDSNNDENSDAKDEKEEKGFFETLLDEIKGRK
ncbi:MAG: hypothetical protein NTV44_00600 [Firmicutes bacterium]|nr:hypothetical protein [Bacillota bacterium]